MGVKQSEGILGKGLFFLSFLGSQMLFGLSGKGRKGGAKAKNGHVPAREGRTPRNDFGQINFALIYRSPKLLASGLQYARGLHVPPMHAISTFYRECSSGANGSDVGIVSFAGASSGKHKKSCLAMLSEASSSRFYSSLCSLSYSSSSSLLISLLILILPLLILLPPQPPPMHLSLRASALPTLSPPPSASPSLPPVRLPKA